MKKFYLLLCLSLVVASAKSQLLFEPFNYTPHATNGLSAQSGGAWAIVNTGDSILVNSGSLTYAGLPASTGNKAIFDGAGTDYYTGFAAQTSGTIYFSHILNVSSLGALDATGGYYTTLIQDGSTTAFGASIWTRASTTPGKYNVGISTRSNSTVAWVSMELDPGTAYFIVGSYEIVTGSANDISKIWVNPALGGTEPAAGATAPSGSDVTAAGIGRIMLRQDSNPETAFTEVDELRVGATWADVTPSGGVSPALSATSLTSFGAICTGTTAGPNSFTISGSNLTTANVTVAALAGFTYSTTSGGIYTTTLSLPSAGGAFSQEIFVKFDPVAVQSYNGNIAIAGGGVAAPINVAATGSGVAASVPLLTTGGATLITSSSATLAGTITGTGCSAISAYGIEYSTTSGFANGTGTPVASTNLAGGSFSSNVAGLAASTTYYYHAFATNTTGTGYGTEQSFTSSGTGVATGVVISQVYGGGGNTLATYTNDFIELFNRTTAPIDISGWSVQYASAAGTSWSVTAIPAATILAPGKYYLVGLGSGGANGVALPTPDVIGTTNMSGTAGKVALVNNAVALTGATACSGSTVVDVLGYAATASCFETAFFAPTGIDNTKSMFRKTAGCTETDNNGADFEVLVVAPRNSATAANICGVGSPTLTVSTLTSFGNVCINTTAGPNSFTITGANLSTADVTIAALTGFTYSTTSGGTYTTTLTLPSTGGAFSQEVFVQFAPVLVQPYDGNIVVAGGGANALNVAATGSGVNSLPTVVSGAASAITQTSATVDGSIPSIGCSAITANYGIEYSTTMGFANGTGTPVLSTNLAGGSFSSALSGLAPATTYYYHAFATNAGGTAYGAELSFATVNPNPAITTTALTAFGNACINTTAGPNSFTITGTNLTNANVTVGALAGFTYSTSSGGVYTTTLSLTQPGGPYSQQIFVRFTPTAVQSYNGNIPVAGGGVAATVNVAASGAGISTAPTVTTGAASAITQTTATTAGSIPNTGCTAITTYGIEYSTTNGFPNGSGTAVASTNLAAGNFTSALTGLTPATTYYYHAYATNAGGTSYGAQQSFITVAPTLSATTPTAFGSVCVNTTTGPNSFTITGVGLTTANVAVGALAGYTYSTTTGGVYTPTLSIAQPGGAFSQQVFVKFTPTLVQSYNGNIPVSGGGAIGTTNVAVTGSGVNTLSTVSTGTVAGSNNNSAELNGSIAANGCSNVTAYGIEFSGINGFLNGNGTQVPAGNIAGGNFSATLTGLVQGATYYYKAYATSAGGTSYGLQESFTVPMIGTGFHLYPSPVARGGSIRITVDGVTPGYYGVLLYDSQGRMVFQKDINIQVDFINQLFTIPATLQTGIYRAYLVNYKERIGLQTILVQ